MANPLGTAAPDSDDEIEWFSGNRVLFSIRFYLTPEPPINYATQTHYNRSDSFNHSHSTLLSALTMKIYTKQGDSGETSLYGGTRVLKSNARIQAYGTVDELNSACGLILSFEPSTRIHEILSEIQNQLFVLGADLATPMDGSLRIDRVTEAEVEQLEKWIDELEETNPPLKNFILPGGSPSGAFLHLARTVCRRAEREAILASNTETISEHAIRYLNRLSDLLFVMARFENLQKGVEEVKWTPLRKDS